MKKFGVLFLLAATTAIAFPMASVHAQGGGGYGGGGGGGMRNSAKGRLTGLVRGIGNLERGGKAPLTPAQARIVVGSVSPWMKRPRMNENDARGLYMRINSALSTRQKNELDKTSAENRRFGGGGGGGGWRGGQGGQGGQNGQANMPTPQQMQQMRAFRETYNPFYPPSNYRELNGMPDRMRQGFFRRYQAQQALLMSLARKAHGGR